MYLKNLHPSLPFFEAAALYMQQRTVDATPGAITARYIKQTTETSYWAYIRSLELFFGKMKLSDIHVGHLKSYQRARISGDAPFVRRRRPHEEPKACPTKPPHINQELGMLRSIMRRANAWSSELMELYEELQEEQSEVQRALSPEEQRLWVEVSRLKPRWEIIHWYSLVAFDTTMSTNEMRGLRMGDVNLHHQIINVPWPASKNKYRHRSIALESADCMWALDRLMIRARDLGAHEPQHYLFPFRNKRTNSYEAHRHMTESGVKKLWQEVREATGLKWFRPYDTRHTGITRLAEAGIPIEIIKSKAGHISDKMSRHYTHIGLSVQRRWMQFANELKMPPRGDYNPHLQPIQTHPMFRGRR